VVRIGAATSMALGAQDAHNFLIRLSEHKTVPAVMFRAIRRYSRHDIQQSKTTPC